MAPVDEAEMEEREVSAHREGVIKMRSLEAVVEDMAARGGVGDMEEEAVVGSA